jgi:hypothetical protein
MTVKPDLLISVTAVAIGLAVGAAVGLTRSQPAPST